MSATHRFAPGAGHRAASLRAVPKIVVGWTRRAGLRAIRRCRLGISARFGVVLVAVVLALIGVGAAGLAAVSSTHKSLDLIYSDNVVTAQMETDLESRLHEVEATVLKGLLTGAPQVQARESVALATNVLPAVGLRIATVAGAVDDNAVQGAYITGLERSWSSFTHAFAEGGLGGGSLAARNARAALLAPMLEQAATDAHEIYLAEGAEAKQRSETAAATYHDNVRLVIEIVVLGLLASLLIVVWLIRSMLPRTLAYSRFAERMAEGDYSARLEPSGADEIARLGRTLDEVAKRRQEGDSYDRTQIEFSDALQLTEDELEAQDLLRRHLERSIASSTVAVLNRNNSADRLQAVTVLEPDSPLLEGLKDAGPRSCLAVRSAAVHTQTHGQDSLVSCEVCRGCPGLSTCTPLLVGGEVIGAVLVNHHTEFGEATKRRVRESVRQAAPVIANLRNLAISQTRASTDTLTGLPNRRALDDTIKRMVAQASRAALNLSALMIDLDHFKQINDQLGHPKGDEILAAFGAQLHDLLRESDFAARYGGEEFVVLLPATGAEGAAVLAEKLRLAVRALRVPGVDRMVTVSIGIAVLPDHAYDSETLERAADRALYLAKANGRDRIEVAVRDVAVDDDAAAPRESAALTA